MRKKINRLNKGSIGYYDIVSAEGINTLTSQYTNYSRNLNPKYDVYNDNGNTYAPPAAWRSLPTINVGEQKFAGVYAVYDGDGNFLALRGRGAYIVDWGDGTTGAFADNATAQKVYNQSTYAGLTSDVYKGYKTLVIQVTPQAGATLTSLEIGLRHASVPSRHNTQWLNILMSAPELTTLSLGYLNSQEPTMLEQFIFIGTNKITTGATSLFAGARQLQKVWLDTTTFTNPYQMFFGCTSLKCLPSLNTRNWTNLNNVFGNCYSLTSVPFMDTRNVTNIAGAFGFCYSLKSLPPINTSNVTNFDSAFRECYALVEVPPYDFSKATTINLLFNACYNLKKVPRIVAPNCTIVSGAFQGCFNLIRIEQFVVSPSITSINNLFATCSALEEVPFFDTSNVTNMGVAFRGCNKLKKIPNYNTSNVTNFANTFNSCWALEEFPKLDYSKATSMAGAFNQCFAMQGGTNFGLTLGNVTDFNTCFTNCQSIQYLPPLNLPNVTNVNNAFSQCFNLKQINITGVCAATANLNISSFNNLFNSCYSLQSITGYIDFSGYTGAGFASVLSGIFTNDSSLEYIGITGIQQTFSVLNCKLGATALNNIYSSLATVSGKTITVTGNYGVTNDNPAIATAKGWTVTG